MRPKPLPSKTTPGERVVKDIWRATRRPFSAEDKIRIVRVLPVDQQGLAVSRLAHGQ